MLNDNQKLKSFLEQAYGKEIPDSEFKEHKERFIKFVGFLVEIDQKNKKKGQNG